MRTVKVFSTRDGKQIHKVETDATTWGVLRALLIEKGLYSDSMSAIESSTKVTMEHDAIVLPEGDFLIMMVPKNSKAGAEYSITEDDIEDFLEDFRELLEGFLDGQVSDPELNELQEGLDSFLEGLRNR